MSNRNAISALVLCALLVSVSAHASSPKSAEEQLVRNYLQARVGAMQEHSTVADVERALSFCTDDFVYEHPAAGARIQGKSLHIQGMSSHLGETKDARFSLLRTIANQRVVVADVQMNFSVRQDDGKWKPGGRHNITVFELENKKIKRIIDY